MIPPTVPLGPGHQPGPVGSVSRLSRVYGFGSVYGKALRDSRRAVLVVSGFVSLIVLFVTYEFVFMGPAQMQQLLDSLPPSFLGVFYGSDTTNMNTLGGFMTREGRVFFLVLPIWSILALSATLADETRRGSLEFVAGAPTTKRRIAVQKLAAHLTVVLVTVAIVGLAAWLSAVAFARRPVDAIALGAALGWSTWLGLSTLLAGSIAFALAPFLGRAAAAGMAGLALAAAYLVDGFSTSIPAFASIGKLSWFSLTASFNPMAGKWSWEALAALIPALLILFALGVEGFARRDLALGSQAASAASVLPRPAFGFRGPTGRSLSELLIGALAWGIGIGAYGLIVSASSRSFEETIATIPGFDALMQSLFPTSTVTASGGFFHQATFMSLAYPVMGLAAATLVAGWASDETSGRLEMLLTTPLAPGRWLLGSGLGVYLAIAAMTAVVALGVAVGLATVGGDIVTAVVGTFILALYGAALAGIGLAVGGLLSTRVAGMAVAVVAVAAFLVDFLVRALNLPDWVRSLVLSAHFGQPMLGTWDPTGLVAALILAAGGLGVGAWGMRRRDVSR